MLEHQTVRRLRRIRERVQSERAGFSYASRYQPTELELPEGNGATPLSEFFDAYTTGPGINKWRHYFGIYHRHLARFRDRPCVLVEIGVASGGSLRMWRDYLPHAQIHGVDIDPTCKDHENEQVTIHIGDQASPGFWRDFLETVPAIDIVIDDGGHEPEQQIATLEALLPHLSAGGVYICEDVHTVDQRFHDYVCGLARNLHSFDRYNAFRSEIESVSIYPFVVALEKRSARLELRAEQHGSEWLPHFGP